MKFEGVTSPERSNLMKKIRGIDTKQEIKLRKTLWSKGYRYRKNYSGLPGKPDIALLRYKVAIFIDGEFWHGYNWEEKKEKILSNREYWIVKIANNIERDKRNNAELTKMGYIVLRFWEHDLSKCFDDCVEIIERAITNQT